MAELHSSSSSGLRQSASSNGELFSSTHVCDGMCVLVAARSLGQFSSVSYLSGKSAI